MAGLPRLDQPVTDDTFYSSILITV